jgi:SAM-dependent MidA family methyltransferase
MNDRASPISENGMYIYSRIEILNIVCYMLYAGLVHTIDYGKVANNIAGDTLPTERQSLP